MIKKTAAPVQSQPTVYATIALVAAGLSCLCCCVLKCRAADDTDKKGVLFILGPMAVPLLLVNTGFWIGCTTTDSSVEWPYGMTMLVVGSVCK